MWETLARWLYERPGDPPSFFKDIPNSFNPKTIVSKLSDLKKTNIDSEPHSFSSKIDATFIKSFEELKTWWKKLEYNIDDNFERVSICKVRSLPPNIHFNIFITKDLKLSCSSYFKFLDFLQNLKKIHSTWCNYRLHEMPGSKYKPRTVSMQTMFIWRKWYQRVKRTKTCENQVYLWTIKAKEMRYMDINTQS